MGTKVRWGDTLDDEDALPPTSVKGPDANGVKVVTEYYKGDKGEAFKKTTKTKIVKVEKKVYKVRDEALSGVLVGRGGLLQQQKRALFHSRSASAHERARASFTRRFCSSRLRPRSP